VPICDEGPLGFLIQRPRKEVDKGSLNQVDEGPGIQPCSSVPRTELGPCVRQGLALMQTQDLGKGPSSGIRCLDPRTQVAP